MIRQPPRSTLDRSSAASDVYKRQSKDNDCNTVVDDAPGAPTWYKDVDGDNHGDKNVAAQKKCTSPGAGYVQSVNANDDCNDGDLAIYPGHTETCDSKDNDCNNVVDD